MPFWLKDPYAIWKDVWIRKRVSTYLEQNVKRVWHMTPLKKRLQEIFHSGEYLWFSVNLPFSPAEFCKTAVQTICAKFSRKRKKHLRWGNFWIHLQAERLQLHMKRSPTQVFSGEFCKDFQNGYLTTVCGCFWNLSYSNKNFENSFIVLCLLCQNGCRTKIRLSKK